MPCPSWRLRPFDLANVKITDGLWAQRQKVNSEVTIPYEYKQCKATGRLDAFKLDWKPGQPNPPHIFWDSDVAKWLEAACYALTTHPNRKTERMVEEVASLIVGAQQPDGYLNVHFTVVEPETRWANLRDWHELYCAGHLMEAAVAHEQATGKRELLDALARYADCIDSVFGKRKRTGYPGHEEIELALVKLYHATGNGRHLKLSKYFIDERGKFPHLYDKEARARGEGPAAYRFGQYDYNQSHLPVREQTEAVGHSVRAMYLYAGMADIAAETGDEALMKACEHLWESTTARKMYVTGGVGSSHTGERFTTDYDLPNATAYAETCAGIGLVFFAHRMLQITGDAKYADAIERALYNGVLSGVSLSGDRFFYVNPLESSGDHHRQEWFGCACCPPNIARLIASLGTYVYSAAPKAVYVHLYAASQGQAEIAGQEVTLTQETDYPWHGVVKLRVNVAKPCTFTLMLRIPGWCRWHKLTINGEETDVPVTKGYAKVGRRWSDGDEVTLTLAMWEELVAAHPRVSAAAGQVALQRGPIVYCLEQCDHSEDVRSILLPTDDLELTSRFDSGLIGGAVVVQATALAPSSTGWGNRLYRPSYEAKTKRVKIKAIPYCLWDNREPGPMTVWMHRGAK